MARPLAPRFLRLTTINILSNIAVPVAGLVDTAMLGHLEDIRFLAGVALATLIFDALYWSFGFLRMGTTGLVAQAIGSADVRSAMNILRRGGLLALAFGLALIALQVPIRELAFWLLSGDASVELAGRAYYSARIWAAPATLTNFVLVGWLLGQERSQSVLGMTVAASLSNIALNYLFIVQLGWAAAGAGWATTGSQLIMLMVGLGFYLRYRTAHPWSRAELLQRNRLAELFRLNRDILIRTLLLVACFATFTNFSAVMGTTALAANALLLRIFYLSAYAIDGAALAAESLAGIFRGARDSENLRRLFKLSLSTGLLFAAGGLGLLFANVHGWLSLLTLHEEVVWHAVHFSPWLIPVLLFGAMAFVYDGLYIGLTEGRQLRRMMLISAAVYAPVAWLAIQQQSNQLLWLALTLFMVARTASLGWASRALFQQFDTWTKRPDASLEG